MSYSSALFFIWVPEQTFLFREIFRGYAQNERKEEKGKKWKDKLTEIDKDEKRKIQTPDRTFRDTRAPKSVDRRIQIAKN